MAVEVILPRVDMDMTEGKVALWHVRSGEAVAKGQVVFEMETDKATMEIEASADGVIHVIDDELDVPKPVGQVLAWILESGEAVPGPTPATVEMQAVPAAAEVTALGTATSHAVADAPGVRGAGVRATPLARSLARARGIDLAEVQGSGDGGRIYAADLAKGAPVAAPRTTGEADLHLHWFARHEAAPLVLLHGFGADLGSWRPLVAQMSGMAALGLDLPNHGKSSSAATRNFSDLAHALRDRLDAEGVGALHLLGHSLGGGAALALAGLLGDRLRSLTLLAPVGLGPEINGAFVRGLLGASREESLRPWLAELFGDTRLLTASFVATAFQQLRAPEKRQALASMAEHFFPDGTQAESLRDRLYSLELPVKLVWGALDRIAPVRQASGLPGHVAVHTLAGVGHLPQVEAVSLLARLLRQQIAAAAANGH